MRFKIDLNETFPHLPGAPIVEAVIHWRARAEAKLDADQLRQELAARLPAYPVIRPQQEFHFTARGSADGSEISQRVRWQGFRMSQGDEGRYVVQFKPEGLVVSRLAPYDDWDTFEAEALRLWEIFVELARPVALPRLGVRFINRVELAAGERPEQYLRPMPKFPREFDLPIETFFHRDVLAVPDTPFRVNLLRTVQPSEASGGEGAVILDIDVYTSDVAIQREPIKEHLTQMRWIKNKIFFSLTTRRAIKQFEKVKP